VTRNQAKGAGIKKLHIYNARAIYVPNPRVVGIRLDVLLDFAAGADA
jgi:hypothetical protein